MNKTHFNQIKIGHFNAFTDNYIWFLANDAGIIVVDPGESTVISDYLIQNKLELQAIILTHDHADHIGGVNNLLDQKHVPVYGTCDIATTKLIDGQLVNLPLNLDAKIFFTPGHTHNSICYLITTNNGCQHLFCGDTLFAAGCGRVFTGDYPAMYNSLQLISNLNPQTLIYPAHEYTLSNMRFAIFIEPDNIDILKRDEYENKQIKQYGITLPTNLAFELKTNPFLRCNDSNMVKAVSQIIGQPINPGLECFIKLRELKNNF